MIQITRIYADKHSIKVNNNHSSSDLESSLEEKLTIYEREKLRRDGEFDKRISMFKEELALSNANKYKGTPAQELHPSVHNLPHNIINAKEEILPDVEESV